MASIFGSPTTALNRYINVKNVSGGDLAIGSVVVWSDMSKMEVTTTTTDGDLLVAGVVAFNKIKNGEIGQVQTWGRHTAVLISEDLTASTFVQSSDTAANAKGGTASFSKSIGIALETNTPGALTCAVFLKIGPGSEN